VQGTLHWERQECWSQLWCWDSSSEENKEGLLRTESRQQHTKQINLLTNFSLTVMRGDSLAKGLIAAQAQGKRRGFVK
jgi:hypothetical protein